MLVRAHAALRSIAGPSPRGVGVPIELSRLAAQGKDVLALPHCEQQVSDLVGALQIWGPESARQ